MQDVLDRGASRLALTRAAVAAARSVLPLVRQWKDEAAVAVEAAEAWVSHPNIHWNDNIDPTRIRPPVGTDGQRAAVASFADHRMQT